MFVIFKYVFLDLQDIELYILINYIENVLWGWRVRFLQISKATIMDVYFI